jgi:predicted metal-dependent phosphoesterase TrpH
MPKYELHVHTAEGDKVVKESAAQIVRQYRDAGFDGMVVTNHYFSIFFDWFADELQGASHRQIMDRWLKGYRVAREEGQKLGFDVLLGAEVRFDGCPNDYLLYGVDEEFFYQAPLLNRLKNVGELIALLPEDVCVVHAHPFRMRGYINTSIPPVFDGLDGIEIYNAGNPNTDNRPAYQKACELGLSFVSGADAHHTEQNVGLSGLAFDRPIHDNTERVAAIRAKIGRPIILGEIAQTDADIVRLLAKEREE